MISVKKLNASEIERERINREREKQEERGRGGTGIMRCWGRENSDFGKVSVSLENTPRNLLETLKLHVDIS